MTDTEVDGKILYVRLVVPTGYPEGSRRIGAHAWEMWWTHWEERGRPELITQPSLTIEYVATDKADFGYTGLTAVVRGVVAQ